MLKGLLAIISAAALIFLAILKRPVDGFFWGWRLTEAAFAGVIAVAFVLAIVGMAMLLSNRNDDQGGNTPKK